MKEFKVAAQRAQETEAQPILFALEGENADGSTWREEFAVKPPTMDQFALVIVAAGSEEENLLSALFDFFREVMYDEPHKDEEGKPTSPAFINGYNRLKGLVRSKRLPLTQLIGGDEDTEEDGTLIAFLMEQVQTFPTPPPRASSGSRGNTGTRSTGRSPGPGSIHSKP